MAIAALEKSKPPLRSESATSAGATRARSRNKKLYRRSTRMKTDSIRTYPCNLWLKIFLQPRPRVMPIVGRAQMYIRDVRVDLRRRNIAVSQQCLNRAGVGAVLQEVCREAVTQRVWRNVFNPCLFGVTLDHGPRELPRKRLTAIQKNIWRRRLSIARLYCRVLLQPMNRAFAERHATFFVPFAVTHDKPGKQVNVLMLQRHQLRNSQAGGIHYFENGAIAYAFLSRNVRRCKHAVDLVFSKKLRQVTETLRRIEIFCRVRLEVPIQHQELEKTACSTDCARDRCRRQPFA